MNPLIAKYGSEKRWVNWKLLKVKGKATKIPYAINGRKASSTDPGTWATHDDAFAAAENIGIIFLPDRLLLGIDIDHCIEGNEIVHVKGEMIKEFLNVADTYVEISPSGTGLHIFLALTAPLDLIAHKSAPFELYADKRYFTFTGKPLREPAPVREVTPEQAVELLALIGYPWKKIDASSAMPADQKMPKHSSSIRLDDSRILEKMFASKNGDHIRHIYEGQTDLFGGDESSADMALCSHLAFWSGKDALTIERLWIASPLGSRKKTQDRADYRAHTVANAILGCADAYEPGPREAVRAIDADVELDLLYVLDNSKEKVFTMNTENMCRILRKHPDFKDTLRFDSFKNSYEIQWKGKWRALEDNDSVNLQTAISIIFPCFGKVGKMMIFDAMVKVAKENAVDSAADWMRSLRWDGAPRLDDWFFHAFGAPQDEYHKAVASNWWKGMVKRAIHPGSKFDYVLVLEGPQGSKKSTSLSTIGGDWHVETAMSTDNKDFFMQFQGKLIVEFSEGETLSRTEVKRMKAIITMQTDRYRPSYGRVSEDFPRHCVFAMTTNQTEYLKDETGNRRWLPVRVVKDEADIAWLSANREQLYAEAYERVIKKNESVYDFPKEATVSAQEARRVTDANEDLIVDWYWNKLTDAQRDAGITNHQVYRDAIHAGFASKPMQKWDEMSIANVLRLSLNLEKKRQMAGRVRLWRWWAKDLDISATPVAAPQIPAAPALPANKKIVFGTKPVAVSERAPEKTPKEVEDILTSLEGHF